MVRKRFLRLFYLIILPALLLNALQPAYSQDGTTGRRVESDNGLVGRVGNWTAQASTEASGGSYLYSNGSPDDVLNLEFEGASVSVLYIGGPNFGTLAIEVDGTVVRTVITTSEQTAFNQQAVINYLSEGAHTLRVYAAQGTVAIDAFETIPVGGIDASLQKSALAAYEKRSGESLTADVMVSDVRIEGDWAFGMVIKRVPSDVHGAPELSLFLAKKSAGKWTTAFEHTPEFTAWLAESPESFMSQDARMVLSESGVDGTGGIQGDGASQVGFPFAAGETWGFWSGPHADGSRCFPTPSLCPYPNQLPWAALDFGSGTGNVRAAANGVVVRSPTCPNYIRIDHVGGWSTGYYHIVNEAVTNGQVVTQGTFIGNTSEAVGCGGGAVGAHVHFTLLVMGPGGEIEVHLDGMDIGGWTVHRGSNQYEGCLERVSDGQFVCRGNSITHTGLVGGEYLDSLVLFNAANGAISRLNTLTQYPPSGAFTNYFLGAPALGQGVMGDWNGDGQKTPGVYGTDGVFYFTNTLNPPHTWTAMWFGLFGRPAVVGRFSNAGQNDCIGVMDSANFPPFGTAFALYFTCNMVGGNPVKSLQWVSVVLPDAAWYTGAHQFAAGDFDNDGIDSIAVRRGVAVAWTNIPPTTLLSEFALAQYFGAPITTDEGYFVVGNWDDFGVDTFGVVYQSGWFYWRDDLGWNSGSYSWQLVGTPIGGPITAVVWRQQ